MQAQLTLTHNQGEKEGLENLGQWYYENQSELRFDSQAPTEIILYGIERSWI